MKLTPMQLFGIAAAGFFAILGANFLFNYKSEQTAQTLSKLSPAELFGRRTQLIAEENMESVPVQEEISEEE